MAIEEVVVVKEDEEEGKGWRGRRMNEGVMEEEGDTQTVFNQPVHDYTKTLLAAAPRFNRNQPI